MTEKNKSDEYQAFKSLTRRLVAVPKSELEKRETAWKKRRIKKRRQG